LKKLEVLSVLTNQAKIRITNLRLRTYIGFNPDEREKPQDVVINVIISHRLDPAAAIDEVEAALDYKVITKRIISLVENGRFLLLEKLTHDVLTICAEHRDVVHAEVTIDKPHALRFADSVSITLEYDQAQAHKARKEVNENYPRSVSVLS
jgi:D-erythro-7,8-dihydroneopterin triphosphate epimerase